MVHGLAAPRVVLGRVLLAHRSIRLPWRAGRVASGATIKQVRADLTKPPVGGRIRLRFPPACASAHQPVRASDRYGVPRVKGKCSNSRCALQIFAVAPGITSLEAIAPSSAANDLVAESCGLAAFAQPAGRCACVPKLLPAGSSRYRCSTERLSSSQVSRPAAPRRTRPHAAPMPHRHMIATAAREELGEGGIIPGIRRLSVISNKTSASARETGTDPSLLATKRSKHPTQCPPHPPSSQIPGACLLTGHGGAVTVSTTSATRLQAEGGEPVGTRLRALLTRS